MIHPPYPFRCPDDDSGAPVDYSYVSSVSEGRRRAQQKNIHDEDEQAAPRPLIRHRADPYDRERVDAYGTRAPMRRPDRSGTVQMLPTPEEEAIPENPYDRPAARRHSQPQQEAQPQVIVTEDGSQFDPPAMAKLPEWYRVAQQNASTTDDRMRRAPKVQAAPRFRIPWLGIAVFVMAGLAVGLWLMQLNFQAQTRQVVQERAQARIAIREKHPLEYRELIEREASKNNLNPAFVEAIVFNESTFRTGAESSVGARGLMQVMEDTAADIAKALKVENYSFDQLYDAETNVTFGCYYLGKLSQRFRGDPLLVAMAYHAGGNQVQNWLNTSLYSTDGLTIVLDNLPDGPTKQYAIRVKRDFAIYRRLYYDALEDDA